MAESKSLKTVQSLVTEGLKAGGFLKSGAAWEAFHGGQRLLVRDRKIGANLEGAIVIANQLSVALLTACALSDLPNHTIIGGSLSPDVEMGKVRAERLRYASKMGENYWAVYVIEDIMLVSLGVPFSSSRLVGEILQAQMGHAFEQRRVCAECGELNPYRAQTCKRCNAQLVATGRLNRWMRYDDEETILRKLTPEEEKKLVEQVKSSAMTMVHPWKADTVKHKNVDDVLSAPTLKIKRPRTDSDKPRSESSSEED
jgi:ribosomal protein L40E